MASTYFHILHSKILPQPPAYFQISVLILFLVVLIHIFDSFVNAVSDVKTTPSTSSQTIWRLRLGHPNANVLRLVLHYCFFLSAKINIYINLSTRGTKDTSLVDTIHLVPIIRLNVVLIETNIWIQR